MSIKHTSGYISDISDIRATPAVLYVRPGVVATAWCTVYHALPPGADVEVLWYYPDGQRISAPTSYHGSERSVNK